MKAFYYYKDQPSPLSEYKEHLTLHRLEGAAVIHLTKKGELISEEWYLDGKPHREDGPAKTLYDENRKMRAEEWWLDGKIRPSPLYWRKNYHSGALESIEYDYPKRYNTNLSASLIFYHHGFLKEEIWRDGTGLYHRENGPASILYDKEGFRETEKWYLHNHLHRKDGAAIIHWDQGYVVKKEWWINHHRHREDGPAVIEYNILGEIISEEWWLEGETVTHF